MCMAGKIADIIGLAGKLRHDIMFRTSKAGPIRRDEPISGGSIVNVTLPSIRTAGRPVHKNDRLEIFLSIARACVPHQISHPGDLRPASFNVPGLFARTTRPGTSV